MNESTNHIAPFPRYEIVVITDADVQEAVEVVFDLVVSEVGLIKPVTGLVTCLTGLTGFLILAYSVSLASLVIVIELLIMSLNLNGWTCLVGLRIYD